MLKYISNNEIGVDSMSEFLNYKGRPLVRKGNTVYYGNMDEKYVIQLDILDSEKDGDITTAKNIRIQLLDTDTSLDAKKRVIKKSEKVGLYNAMDIGSIWLERALSEK